MKALLYDWLKATSFGDSAVASTAAGCAADGRCSGSCTHKGCHQEREVHDLALLEKLANGGHPNSHCSRQTYEEQTQEMADQMSRCTAMLRSNHACSVYRGRTSLQLVCGVSEEEPGLVDGVLVACAVGAKELLGV